LRFALDDYFPGQKVILIFGASEDKDIAGMLVELMPRVSKVIVTQANHPRAAPIEDLAKQARAYGTPVELFSSVSEALEFTARGADDEEVILAAGSLFVAGEVLTAWDAIQDDLISEHQVGN
jgi:dihydrofolate synthase/folylpolyglutamate synthase